jgi:hypothetical protein
MPDRRAVHREERAALRHERAVPREEQAELCAFLAMLHSFLGVLYALAATPCEDEDVLHEELRGHHALRGVPDPFRGGDCECVGSSSERERARSARVGMPREPLETQNESAPTNFYLHSNNAIWVDAQESHAAAAIESRQFNQSLNDPRHAEETSAASSEQEAAQLLCVYAIPVISLVNMQPAKE